MTLSRIEEDIRLEESKSYQSSNWSQREALDADVENLDVNPGES